MIVSEPLGSLGLLVSAPPSSQVPELQAGIYSLEGKAVAAVAPKIKGTYAFMVTNIENGSDIKIWCADLEYAGKVAEGLVLAGHDFWNLNGHPIDGTVFVSDGSNLLECDAGWNQLYCWTYNSDRHGAMWAEPAAAPLKTFPTENFKATVVDKDPRRNELYSPSTQTIVEACCCQAQPLSEDVMERQQEMIRFYTMETPLYHEMNQALRDDNFEKMRYFAAYIKELRDVFKTDHHDQLLDPFEGTVWRGIYVNDLEQSIRDYEIGSIFVWPAFTSMTTTKEVTSFFGNLTFEIHCCPPAGTYHDDTPEYAPASVKDFSAIPSEDEIIFPPNIQFRVRDLIQPNDENGLFSPLVICDTVGFDTDEGICEFNQHTVKKQVDAVWKVVLDLKKEFASKLSQCTEQCEQKCEQLCAQLAEEIAAREQLEEKVSSFLAVPPPLPDLNAGEVDDSIHDGGERCDQEMLQLRLLEEQVHSLKVQLDNHPLHSLKTAQTQIDQEICKLARKLESMQQQFEVVHDVQAAALGEMKHVKHDASRLSAQVEERYLLDLKRSEELGHVLSTVADRCFKTQQIVSSEGTHYAINDILKLGARKNLPLRDNAGTSLDIVSQCIGEIGGALRALRPCSVAGLSFEHAKLR